MANNKLREALENVAKQLIDATEDKNFGEDVMYLVGCMRTMSRKCRAALAEPVQNYEVGTAMEQGERFSAYCRAHKHPESECLPCPLFGQTGGHCELAWAQMPYEAVKGGTI